MSSNTNPFLFNVTDSLNYSTEELFAMYEASVLLERIDNEVACSDLAEAREFLEFVRKM